MAAITRNRFIGIVTEIKRSGISSVIELTTEGKDKIHSTISNDSLDRLKIKKGSKATSIIKASSVLISGSDAVVFSTENRFCGKIIMVIRCRITTDITIELESGNTLGAAITNESYAGIKLKKGDRACAFFKASDVIIGIK
jgi:molybdate transport system regulatory protein